MDKYRQQWKKRKLKTSKQYLDEDNKLPLKPQYQQFDSHLNLILYPKSAFISVNFVLTKCKHEIGIDQKRRALQIVYKTMWPSHIHINFTKLGKSTKQKTEEDNSNLGIMTIFGSHRFVYDQNNIFFCQNYIHIKLNYISKCLFCAQNNLLIIRAYQLNAPKQTNSLPFQTKP